MGNVQFIFRVTSYDVASRKQICKIPRTILAGEVKLEGIFFLVTNVLSHSQIIILKIKVI